jgi:hypothetical protein
MASSAVSHSGYGDPRAAARIRHGIHCSACRPPKRNVFRREREALSALNADIIATQWAAADAYRPQYQIRSELNVNTRGSRGSQWKFRSHGRPWCTTIAARARFPTAEGNRVTESSNVFSALLEIRILRAVISYQIRNMASQIYQLVPDLYMHRVINLYGVRWEFVN